ncbi:nicotinamide N-methyltransferase-like protein [Baffinella frigidus]|nr:nicotinamide N-methyltransferase-like protein [Cryptophyta sp. CCMP2293]
MPVVEVGSGTGVVGIAAAILGTSVVITDLPHVLPQLQNNVSVNLQQGSAARDRISVVPLAWGNTEHEAALGKFDLVLCSDCLYREETHQVLLQSLEALSNPDTLVVMALEIRRPPLEANFFTIAQSRFSIQPVEVPFKEDNDVKLWFMRLKA